ncbi:MAG: 50S ribosomal protein L29 [Clostridium sp.]|uniref:50S ribosomal protein L29 n=1 Tax=Clostridium sp. TaxID=1506 RepID=UPI002FCC0B94
MKAKELSAVRENSVLEIQGKVMELKAELFNLRFQLATGQLENPLRIKEVKKSIAQLKTILREKELNA